MDELRHIAGVVGGWIVPMVLGFFMLWPKLRKADTEDAAVALEAWKALAERQAEENKQQADTIQRLRDRIRDLEDAADKERKERREAEEALRAEIQELRDDVAGLHRQIIQNSHSTLQVIPGREKQ